MVRVPTPEEEDRKRARRARALLKERIAHINRIKGLLHGQASRCHAVEAKLPIGSRALHTG